VAPVVTATSIILRSDGIQNANILVLANPGPPGKLAVKTESDDGGSGSSRSSSSKLVIFLFPGADHEVIESISKADIRVHRRVMNRLAVSKLKLLMMEIIETRSLGMHALNLQ